MLALGKQEKKNTRTVASHNDITEIFFELCKWRDVAHARSFAGEPQATHGEAHRPASFPLSGVRQVICRAARLGSSREADPFNPDHRKLHARLLRHSSFFQMYAVQNYDDSKVPSSVKTCVKSFVEYTLPAKDDRQIASARVPLAVGSIVLRFYFVNFLNFSERSGKQQFLWSPRANASIAKFLFELWFVLRLPHSARSNDLNLQSVVSSRRSYAMCAVYVCAARKTSTDTSNGTTAASTAATTANNPSRASDLTSDIFSSIFIFHRRCVPGVLPAFLWETFLVCLI